MKSVGSSSAFRTAGTEEIMGDVQDTQLLPRASMCTV